MTAFFQNRQRTANNVAGFYSGISYETRRTHEAITKLADKVVGVAAEICESTAELVENGRKVLSDLQASNASFTKAEERKNVSNYIDGEEQMLRLVGMFREMENDAVCDPELHGKNENSVTGAFIQCIKHFEQLISVAQEIRWEIMSRTEEDDPAGKPVDIDDYIASMG